MDFEKLNGSVGFGRVRDATNLGVAEVASNAGPLMVVARGMPPTIPQTTR